MSDALTIVRKFFPEVGHVKDADKPRIIEVSSQDAKSKAVRNHRECAMAVACKRAFDLDGVIISRRVAYLVKGKTATRYGLPQSVTREVVSFDRNAGFAPGTYQLSKPEHRLGKRGGNGQPTGEGKPKSYRHFTEGIRASLAE